MEIAGWIIDREAAVHPKENSRPAWVAAAISSWLCWLSCLSVKHADLLWKRETCDLSLCSSCVPFLPCLPLQLWRFPKLWAQGPCYRPGTLVSAQGSALVIPRWHFGVAPPSPSTATEAGEKGEESRCSSGLFLQPRCPRHTVTTERLQDGLWFPDGRWRCWYPCCPEGLGLWHPACNPKGGIKTEARCWPCSAVVYLKIFLSHEENDTVRLEATVCCAPPPPFAVETACNLKSWNVSKVLTSLCPSSQFGFPSFDLSTISHFCIFRLLSLPLSFWTFRVTDPSFPLPLYSVCFQGVILGVPHQLVDRSASF